MYNTTTVPTMPAATGGSHCFFSALISGLLATMPFWFGITCRYLLKERKDEVEESSSSETEIEEPDSLSQKYMTELNALPDKELSAQDLTELQTKIVRETVESENILIDPFDIIMTYNKESDGFWYFTNNLKEVSYTLLESVARKFVVEHQCKRLYLQAQVQQAQVLSEKQAQVLSEKQNVEGQAEEKKPSVFAKFKKYNTGAKNGGTVQSHFNNDEATQNNHFRYKGKLYQLEEYLKQQADQQNTTASLDYAAYKLLML